MGVTGYEVQLMPGYPLSERWQKLEQKIIVKREIEEPLAIGLININQSQGVARQDGCLENNLRGTKCNYEELYIINIYIYNTVCKSRKYLLKFNNQ